ncbi:uncharacterized protein LOC111683725 [Lucilia cuprina]|uniref:uncharacterized protein LOC111683725 n=1 Tax=Lucilia cuprina TaxID=7375 RepID=UPI001F06121A|nr:uncharacterized protein LOC111683725 [Lucilia cuprina]
MNKYRICDYYLFAIIINLCCFLSYGYRHIRLEDNLCADRFLVKLFKDPSMTLREDRDSAAIITQVWNTTMPGSYSSNKIRYDCEFKVHSDEPNRPPRGIYTVITRLKFRHDPVKNKCLDYIQFRNGNRSPSEPICNDISIDGPAGRLIFDQRNRDVSVLIHIDKKRMITEPLELRMVLTAHSECKYTGDFLCEPTNPYTCISRYFVRDNVTNCMYPCRDEVSCFHDAITLEEIDTTNVAISAITSLIFTMLGVGFCIWICWKYWNCITVQQHAHEASAVTNRQRRQRSQQHRSSGQRDVPVIELPTAPTFNTVTAAPVLSLEMNHQQTGEETPKDLPPSYESLFPDR